MVLPVSGSCPAVYRPYHRPSFLFLMLPSPLARFFCLSLELELAIISQWSDSLLKLAPCQYQGSAYLDNMILAGHNYRAHFAGLKDIQIGDAVIFTDAEDSCFHYEVSGLEELPGTAICEMESGDWDLTLFTCTAGGSARFTVRCIKSEPSHAPGGAPDQVL